MGEQELIRVGGVTDDNELVGNNGGEGSSTLEGAGMGGGATHAMIGGEQDGGSGLLGDQVELAKNGGGGIFQGTGVEVDGADNGIDDHEFGVEELDGLVEDFEMVGKAEGSFDHGVDEAVWIDRVEGSEDMDTIHIGPLVFELLDEDTTGNVGGDDNDISRCGDGAIWHYRTSGCTSDQGIGKDGFAALGVATDRRK